MESGGGRHHHHHDRLHLGLPIMVFIMLICFVDETRCEISSTSHIKLPPLLRKPSNSVEIINNLGGSNVLTLHCKSKSDDMGIKKLDNSQSFKFYFNDNIWGTTLFFCSFQWGSHQFHRLDVYVAGKVDCGKDHLCRWSVSATGQPCLYNYHTKKFDICNGWND